MPRSGLAFGFGAGGHAEGGRPRALQIAALLGQDARRAWARHRLALGVEAATRALLRRVEEIAAERLAAGRFQADAEAEAAERLARLRPAVADFALRHADRVDADAAGAGGLAAIEIILAGGSARETPADAVGASEIAALEVVCAGLAIGEALAETLHAVGLTAVEVVRAGFAIIQALADALHAVAEAAVDGVVAGGAVIKALADAVVAAGEAALGVVGARFAVVAAAALAADAVSLAAVPAVAAFSAEGDAGAVPGAVLLGRVFRAALAAGPPAAARFLAAALPVG